MVRIGCSDAEQGQCVPKNCINFQSHQNCPLGASQPCVYSYTKTHTQSGGDVVTVGQQVTLSVADMAHITEGLQHQTFSDTTVSSTGQSVIALKPGASSCVFQSVEVESNGPAKCGQWEISGSTNTGTTGKQCYMDPTNAAVNYPICNIGNVCGNTMVGNVTMI
jgi:hypothetical protein